MASRVFFNSVGAKRRIDGNRYRSGQENSRVRNKKSARSRKHQRNAADPEDAATIYGRLLWRVRHAGLSHGIKAILWHQGENDQGADGPTGGFGYETYRAYFLQMAAAWKGENPRPLNIAAATATGVPKPDAPSMNAPNAKAISSACSLRSWVRCPTEFLMISN